MAKAYENKFRIYCDTVRQLSGLKVCDVCETLDAFQRRVDDLKKLARLQRYGELVRIH